MAAAIPVKDDEAANAAAFAQGRRRQASAKSATAMTAPGSRIRRWSPAALEAFDLIARRPTSLADGPTRSPGRDAMLELHDGARTEAGARETIRVGVQYLAAWLGGHGAVPLYNLMEDAATAEICRTMLWQWRRF